MIAGFCTNHTMNIQETWCQTFDWPFEHHNLKDVNIVIHSDGGTRRHRCSASAWIVEVGVIVKGAWIFKPLAMAGTFFSVPISSFAAELLALEESALFVKSLLKRGPEHEPLGKTRKMRI